MGQDNDLREIFFAETNESVQQLEQDILSLENNADAELVNRIFRAAHSMKGSAAFVGFDQISSFSHKVENLLDLVRNNQINIDSILVNTLLKALDIIKKMLNDPDNNNILEGSDAKEALAQIRRHLPGADDDSAVHQTAKKDLNTEKHYRVIMNFKRDIFELGTDPLIFFDELESKGSIIEQNINLTELPDIYGIDPYLLYITWNILLKSKKSQKEIEDIFIFVMDDNNIRVDEIGEDELKVEDKKIGEILVEKGLINVNDIQEALDRQPKLGEILIQEGKVMQSQVEKVIAQQQEARRAKEATSIRVDTGKLDKLMNLVGELVINQARVAQISSSKEKIDILELNATAEALDRITRNIQEQIMRARMVPIENTFMQFNRMVRDLSSEKNKVIKLQILGKETELDKTLIELISDPLKHMIRNSIDHGIEEREERLSAGKDECGTIILNAYHEAGNIVIEVTDDGHGLSKEKILHKAKEKGLIPWDRDLSEEETYKLIFLPGFSTAEEISEISGRGVGMDVVKNNIAKLRGNVEISSVEGHGTTFRIILPLTLAIIDGMLVKVGEELYVIPLLAIVESIRPKESEVKHVNVESEVISVRGEYIPLIRLYELFGTKTEHTDPSKALTVIVSLGKNKACLLVDDIIGQQQAVIKSLEDNFSSIRGISGATILGDGTVAMILDIATIIKIAANNN